MELNIDELLKRLTMNLMASESYAPLYDCLDLDQDELFSDISNQIDLKESELKKEAIENEISSGLSNLMEYYENEWTVMVIEDDGNEVEMNLSEAMRHKKIKSFKTDWSLGELNDNWTSETFDVVDEEDEMTLDDYYVPSDDEALSSQKFSQENLDTLKSDKNTKLEILKDIFTDIDFPDYANKEWYSALAHQKSVAELEFYWEGILPDYPNVAKTLASNHHINKKLLSDVRNFGKKLEKIEETKNIGYAIEDLVFANPIFIELRFEIFAEGKDFFEEFYEPEKRRNSYFPLFLKNPNMPIDVLKKLVDEYDYYEAKEHPNYPKSNNLGVKIKNINEEHKISFELRMPTAEELDITDEQWEEQGWEWFSEPELLTSSIELGISNLDLSYDDFIDYIMNPKGNNWEKGDDVNTLKFPILGDWLIKVYNDSKSLLIDDMAGENVMLDYAILSIQIIENNDYDKAYKASKNIGENGSLSELYYEILDSIND